MSDCQELIHSRVLAPKVVGVTGLETEEEENVAELEVGVDESIESHDNNNVNVLKALDRKAVNINNT